MRTALRAAIAVTALLAFALIGAGPAPRLQAAPAHPRLFFDSAGLRAIVARSSNPALAPVASRLLARAKSLLEAPPILVSTTGRGEPDPPGHLKGIESARRLQGRVATFAMAFRLTGDRTYRDAAVSQIDHAIAQWPIWVDTAHQPPYDLMTGEVSFTVGLAYDWLYDVMTPAERDRFREGAERRALRPYLEVATRPSPIFWFTADHNWNPVCNGGAAVLALALIWHPVEEPWMRALPSPVRPQVPAIGAFPAIGWAMLAPTQPDPPFFLAFKNGSLAANHSHLDLNHITVGIGDRMLLVDLGSRPYPAD